MNIQKSVLWRMFVVYVILHFLLLQFVSWGHILHLAIAALSLALTDFIFKIVWDSVPEEIMEDLDDKVVLVTGCDSGFGNALARQLDAKGVTVFAGCLFINGPGALKLKDDCSGKLHIIQLDVTSDEQVKAAVDTVNAELKGKRLCAVVNNAGVFLTGEVEYTSVETMRNMLEVNTLGVARVSQAFLPLLRKFRGRLVIVASLSGRVSLPCVSAYNMSKYATVAYAECLRRELMRWDVPVITIEPFTYRTDMANEELLMKNILNEWNKAPVSVQTAYGGDNYIKHYKNSIKRLIWFANPETKIYEVVHCMVQASIGKNPKVRYVPGIYGKMVTYILTNLNSNLLDLFSQPIFYKGIVRES